MSIGVNLGDPNFTSYKRSDPISLDDLIGQGVLDEPMKDFLLTSVENRHSILIIGPTALGMTSLLNALSQQINPDERIVQIEKNKEIVFTHRVIRKKLEYGAHELPSSVIKKALKHRPDRVIWDVIRSKDDFGLLLVPYMGHSILTTMVSENIELATKKLIELVSGSGKISPVQIPRFITKSINIIVSLERIADGKENLLEISEFVVDDSGSLTTNTLIKIQSGNK